jgi:type I restriction enzyme M protein
MFYNTSIPTCIIVLKKHRDGRDVLFIDASKHFEKEKKQNVMKEEHINRVIELYKNREDVEKEAHVASFEEIEENGFNLNIPRYVDTSEEEEEIDLKQLTAEIKETNKAIKEANESFLNMMNDLTFNTPETKEAVSEFIQILKEM